VNSIPGIEAIDVRAAKTLPEPRFDEVIWLDSTPIARIIGTWSTVDAVHFIHTDHLNSPRALSNARIQGSQPSGTVVWRWPLVTDPSLGSNAFGNQAAIVDPDANSVVTFFSLRFPGQQYDANSGLHYNYFRDYEPATGRYVESDPIGLGGGIGTYAYVESNPLAFTDPSGLFLDKAGTYLKVCTATTVSALAVGSLSRYDADNAKLDITMQSDERPVVR